MSSHRNHRHADLPNSAATNQPAPSAVQSGTLEDALLDTGAPFVAESAESRGSTARRRNSSAPALPAEAATTASITASTATVTGTSAAIKESAALREELKQFALMFDLKPRRRARVPKSDTEPGYQPSLTVRQLAQRAAPFVVLIGVLSATAALRTPAPPVLPEALLGGWETKHPAYADNEIGFVDHEISFRLGRKSELVRYPITAMQTRMRSDTALVSLTYKTETGPVEMNLRLVTGVRPKVIFDRPEGLIWEHPRKAR